MKEWEKESFIALILIHAYPCPPGTTRLFIATHVFWWGTASNDVSSDETTKTNKQTIKKTNMTQPAELDWGCHATTIAWRRRLWDSYSSSVIKYPTFSLGYFHSSLFFFIFKHVRSTIVWILFLAMAESNLPTTGEELEVKNEFPATGEKTQQGKN